MFDPKVVRKDFPILSRTINDKALVYLDSAATSQKPKQVLDTERRYYEGHNSNIHRGAHTLGEEATQAYEDARLKVAEFVGAQNREEIVFVRNTTEAINLVAYTWGVDNLGAGDVVLTTIMEHHSNIVPWQQIVRRMGANLELVRLTPDGQVDMTDYKNKLKLKPKVVAFAHVSNALGTLNPVLEMTKLAHRAGALVLIDGAQAVSHLKINVTELGCDFYVFSGHKMLGPMGIGVLWGRRAILEKMSPFMTGGGMISEVSTTSSTWAKLPEKFEAGTPNVAGAVGLAAAIAYLEKLGMDNVRGHDRDIVEYALGELSRVSQLKLLGVADGALRSGSVSFEYVGVHAHDVATILDSEGVLVRSGHHCTMPLHKQMGIVASIRASFNVYTTRDDIDTLVRALGKVAEVFGK